MKTVLLILACLLLGATHAEAKARARPCQGLAPQRKTWPQGTLLWGTERKLPEVENSSVLVSVNLDRVRLNGTVLKELRLEEGRLVSPTSSPEGLVGAVLQGTASNGQPVEVALCGAETATADTSMVWYRIEIWHARSASWENPCVATHRAPLPRALAVRGVWDETGARHEEPGKFTFACENGAIAKCATWGYKPWAMKEGRSLAPLHQACTRMARADYCGDGRSHTRQGHPIDMYDGLKVLTRTTKASRDWEPAQASFEAAWTPDGAWCLARTRHGHAVETVLAQCPDRFKPGKKELGEGDQCKVYRGDLPAEAALLRNHSYGKAGQSHLQRATP